MSLIVPLAGVGLCGWILWKYHKDHIESQKKWKEWENQLMEDTKNLAYRSAAQSINPPYMARTPKTTSQAISNVVYHNNTYAWTKPPLQGNPSSITSSASPFMDIYSGGVAERQDGMVLRAFQSRKQNPKVITLSYGYSNGNGHDSGVEEVWQIEDHTTELEIISVDGQLIYKGAFDALPIW